MMNNLLEIFPVVCLFVGGFAAERDIERDIAVVGADIAAHTEGHGVLHGDGGEVCALVECVFADACHTGGDGQCGQASVVIESMRSDVFHGAGDDGVYASFN